MINTNNKILLTPDILLNPLSFTLHILTLADSYPLLIPIGWLWEEISKRWDIMHIADSLAFQTGSPQNNLKEKIVIDDSTTELDICAAILSAGNQKGIFKFIATHEYKGFLNSGDWVTYLSNLIDGNIDAIDISLESKKASRNKGLDIVSKQTGLTQERIYETYKKSLDWRDRNPDDYPIFENYRYLNQCLDQFFACAEHKYHISTTNLSLRNVLYNDLSKFGLVELVKDVRIQNPFISKVTFNPNKFNVGDIINFHKSVELLEKFAEIEELLSKQSKDLRNQEFFKQLFLYIFGLFPITAPISNVIQGLNLINEYDQLVCDSNLEEKIILFDSTGWSFI